MDHLCHFCFVLLCFHARLFVDALWSPAGKGLTSWLSFVRLSLSHWYPGSGVVLEIFALYFTLDRGSLLRGRDRGIHFATRT